MTSPKVGVTIREGRRIVLSRTGPLEIALQNVIKATGDAKNSILARAILKGGKTYKFKQVLNGKSFGVTLRPLINHVDNY